MSSDSIKSLEALVLLVKYKKLYRKREFKSIRKKILSPTPFDRGN